MSDLNRVYRGVRDTVVPIATIKPNGDHGIGSGFHVGDGYIITARHVVEGMASVSISLGFWDEVVIAETIFAKNEMADVALLRTNVHELLKHADVNHLSLGVEWDDRWDGDSLLLFDVLVIGHPPIPRTLPTVVAIRAQVNAFVDKYLISGKQAPPSFILSGIPRGGFSGAPMIVVTGRDAFVLGVVTDSFVAEDKPLETGFMAAVTVESILRLLHENAVYPASNKLAVKAFASELTDEEEAEDFGDR